MFNLNELCPNLSSLVVKKKFNERSEGPLKDLFKRQTNLIERLPSKLGSLYFEGSCNYLNLLEATPGLRFLNLRDWPGSRTAENVERLKMLIAYDYKMKKKRFKFFKRSILKKELVRKHTSYYCGIIAFKVCNRL